MRGRTTQGTSQGVPMNSAVRMTVFASACSNVSVLATSFLPAHTLTAKVETPDFPAPGSLVFGYLGVPRRASGRRLPLPEAF